MKVLMLYRTHSETERVALDYARDFSMQTGTDLSLIDCDSPEGVSLARLYDIVDYPAILATAEDGSLLQLWQGSALPRIGEVSYYNNR